LIILFYFILFYFILFYFILFYFILFYFIILLYRLAQFFLRMILAWWRLSTSDPQADLQTNEKLGAIVRMSKFGGLMT